MRTNGSRKPEERELRVECYIQYKVQKTRVYTATAPCTVSTLFHGIQAKIKLLKLTTMLLYKSGHAIERQWFNKVHSSITEPSILAYLHKTIALHNQKGNCESRNAGTWNGMWNGSNVVSHTKLYTDGGSHNQR